MCLAIPGKILKTDGASAEIEFEGLKRKVNVMLVPEIREGEYCLVHAGYAIEKIDESYALQTKKYLEEMRAAEKDSP